MIEKGRMCSYCGIRGHYARACHVKVEGRVPDEFDETSCLLLQGSRHTCDRVDDRMRVAAHLRDLASRLKASEEKVRRLVAIASGYGCPLGCSINMSMVRHHPDCIPTRLRRERDEARAGEMAACTRADSAEEEVERLSGLLEETRGRLTSRF